jgi:hypothetical protein
VFRLEQKRRRTKPHCRHDSDREDRKPHACPLLSGAVLDTFGDSSSPLTPSYETLHSWAACRTDPFACSRSE